MILLLANCPFMKKYSTISLSKAKTSSDDVSDVFIFTCYIGYPTINSDHTIYTYYVDG